MLIDAYTIVLIEYQMSSFANFYNDIFYFIVHIISVAKRHFGVHTMSLYGQVILNICRTLLIIDYKINIIILIDYFYNQSYNISVRHLVYY